jgi:hypothetical protein
MAYKTPQPNVLAFAHPAQQNVIRRIYERISNLEEATNLQSFSGGRKAQAPAQATLAVRVNPRVAGHAYIRITNPQYLGTNRNRITSPLLHEVVASTSPGFNQNVIQFGVTAQTYIDTSELGSGTFYIRLRSTLDGKTFNNPVISKVTIP